MGDCCGTCTRCHACKYIVIGAIVLVTAQYWPMYIWHVLGAVLILKGLLKWVKPNCPHCEPMPKKGKK